MASRDDLLVVIVDSWQWQWQLQWQWKWGGAMEMGSRSEALMVRLREKPGATAAPVPTPIGRRPSGMIYKVMGKMFAIVGRGTVEHVILKCDPPLVDALKATYAGVGHRSHLDRRYWISIDLDADVPVDEVARLVDRSYDLVCETLTRKQRTELAALHK
jgi:predicted DNA-binding protein (MmcQ/YjbR family)